MQPLETRTQPRVNAIRSCGVNDTKAQRENAWLMYDRAVSAGCGPSWPSTHALMLSQAGSRDPSLMIGLHSRVQNHM